MIRKLSIVFFIFLLHLRLSGQQCYTLVWADEFTVNGAPNSSNWTCETGAGGWGNNEIQNYTNSSDNVRVENGNLVIEAKKTNNQWTSARLVTAGKQPFTYGRIEFRAKLPQGSGTWPALWMLGADIVSNPWPACGEIDIMEHVGKNPGQVHSSLHSPSSYGATQNTAFTQVANIFSEFHTYCADWTADSIKFFIDDKLIYAYGPSIKNAQNWPFNKPFFLIMDVAMGGNWGSDPQYETGGLKNGIDPALTSVKMEIDYVRVYQISSKPAINGPKVIDASQPGTFTVPVNDALNYSWQIPSDAEIISGQNTSQIQVKWGNTSGNVDLTLTTSCQTYILNSFPVKSRITPDTSEFHFPVNNTNNQIIWEVATSPGNFLSISQNSELGIYYQISQPLNNPQIKYPFSNIYNFSNYKYFVIQLKNEISNPPTIVRIDLKDQNGNVNLGKIFKITEFSNNNQFNTYVSGIETSSSFDLSNITEINLYINYGIFGSAATGNIYIKDLYLAKQSNMLAPELEKNSPIIYPNPVTSSFIIKDETNYRYYIKIFDIYGKVVMETKYTSAPIQVEKLKRGMYTVMVSDGKNKRYAVKMIKE